MRSHGHFETLGRVNPSGTNDPSKRTCRSGRLSDGTDELDGYPAGESLTMPQEQGISRSTDGRFAPGTSGNPSGRPLGSVSLVAKMRAHLADRIGSALADALGLPPDATVADALVTSTARAAVNGDPAARKLLWAYVEGSPRKSIDFTDTTALLAGRTVAEMLARLDELRAKALASGYPVVLDALPESASESTTGADS